jgi:hypothetical protein
MGLPRRSRDGSQSVGNGVPQASVHGAPLPVSWTPGRSLSAADELEEAARSSLGAVVPAGLEADPSEIFLAPVIRSGHSRRQYGCEPA